MEDTCWRAVEIGLPAVAFTEHADFTPWSLGPGEKVPGEWRRLVSDDVLTPPALDLNGYKDCLDRCRERFPGLRILSGVELSEPQWYHGRAEALVRDGGFDRVLASVHSAPAGASFTEVSDSFRDHSPAQVLHAYLAEIAALISQFDDFEVLAHIDYPVRRWPRDAGPHDPCEFQDEYRHVLRTLASAGKILEINTKVPLHPLVLTWWRQEGGQAITFASDATTRPRWRRASLRPRRWPRRLGSPPATAPAGPGAGTRSRRDRGAVKALAVLAGDSDRAAREITAEAHAAWLDGNQRTGAAACIRYLNGKREFLHYDQALEAGWPIATGVIEGACRHLIADSLLLSGARWGLDGAEAVLTLKAVISNGDFEEYWRFHLEREQQRLYPGVKQGQYTLGA